MKLYTIHNLATDIIAFSGDSSGKTQYSTVIRAIKATLNELNVVGMPTAKTDAFKVGANFTFKMSDNCIDVTKAGVLSVNGKLRMLRRRRRIWNSRLMTEMVEEEDIICSDGDGSADSENALALTDVPTTTAGAATVDAHSLFHNYRGEDYFGEIYGYSPTPGRFGYFEYDNKKNRIIVGGYGMTVDAIVFVEYKPSLSASDYQLLPVETYQMVRYRAMQILTESGNMQKGLYNFDQFRRSFRNYKKAQLTWDMNEIVDAVRGNHRRAIKR